MQWQKCQKRKGKQPGVKRGELVKGNTENLVLRNERDARYNWVGLIPDLSSFFRGDINGKKEKKEKKAF